MFSYYVTLFSKKISSSGHSGGHIGVFLHTTQMVYCQFRGDSIL